MTENAKVHLMLIHFRLISRYDTAAAAVISSSVISAACVSVAHFEWSFFDSGIS